MTAQAEQKIEDWDTSAEDALRTSILATDTGVGHDIAKWNLDQEKPTSESVKPQSKYAVIESNPYDVMPASDTDLPILVEDKPVVEVISAPNHQPESQPSSPAAEISSLAQSTVTIAIYASTDDYFETLFNDISGDHKGVNFVRFTQERAAQFLHNKANLEALIVNMSDDDDDPLLDLLLDQFDEVDTLFLCDPTPSKSCLSKIHSFMDEHDLSK